MFDPRMVDFWHFLAGGEDTCYWLLRGYFSSERLLCIVSNVGGG